MYEDATASSETLAFKLQAQVNHLEESKQENNSLSLYF
jgi:hypothetical protein